MKRTTIFLPDDLHERLRREAFHARVSMAALIRSRLDQAVPRRQRKPRRVEDDPLLKVAGIGHDGTLTQRLDEELYDL
ncbi:MAG TPA: hypothetical protein VEU62_16280 [Bryobacterales bacterium]|nr:hypothetical protein [Bryobacterales bacterium]